MRPPLTDNVNASNSETYSYDNLNRLTNFSRADGTTASWNLDAVGNSDSTTLRGTTKSRTNNAQNQIVTDGDATLDYDANGNTTTDENNNTLAYATITARICLKKMLARPTAAPLAPIGDPA
jgi:uncharacterized protein RhaS with RHS repeats